jgi:hypothetical protein
MTLEQVAEMKPTYQKQKGHKNLLLTPRVTFEVTSYQATCQPNLSTQNNKSQSTVPSQHVRHLLLIDIRLRVGLSGCRRHMKLKHLKLLLEIGNRRCPLLKLKVLLLDVVLEVYDRVHALVQHLASGI